MVSMSASPWSDGYVTDIDYEFFFFSSLAPSHMDFVCLQGGRCPPALLQSFEYLELGCGFGLSSLVLAAANPAGRFWAVDFNPSHIATARRFAAEAELPNVNLIEASFAEFLRTDTPQFDYIALHGVWSWISEQARQDVLEILRTRLKPGGIVYISYNCAVGWERRSSVGNLFKELVRAGSGSLTDRIGAALGVLEALVEQGSGFFADNVEAQRWLEAVKTASPRYLAHEYLNEHWTLFHHADVARTLDGVKLGFIGSSDVLRNFDQFALKERSREIARKIADPVIAETLKDFDTEWGMRRDLYGRGSPAWPVDEAERMLASQQLCLMAPTDKIESTIDTPMGRSTVDPNLLGPVLETLGRGTCSVGELMAELIPRNYNLFDVLALASVLVQNGMAAAMPLRSDLQRAVESSARFNLTVARRTLDGEAVPVFASPALGSGFPAGDLERCCLPLLMGKPDVDAATLAQALQNELARRKRHPKIKGEPADAEGLLKFAEVVLQEQAPVWRRLGILPG
jgi:SAM-dependent methyltransferase